MLLPALHALNQVKRLMIHSSLIQATTQYVLSTEASGRMTIRPLGIVPDRNSWSAWFVQALLRGRDVDGITVDTAESLQVRTVGGCRRSHRHRRTPHTPPRPAGVVMASSWHYEQLISLDEGI